MLAHSTRYWHVKLRGLSTYGILVAFVVGAVVGIPWATVLLTGLLPAAAFGFMAALYAAVLTSTGGRPVRPGGTLAFIVVVGTVTACIVGRPGSYTWFDDQLGK